MSLAEHQELLDEQRREQRAREDRQTAQQIAQAAAMEEGKPDDGYWRVIGDPDISREATEEHIDDFLATELSSAFALGNITYDDWQSWTWKIEGEFWTALNEFKKPGCKLDDVDMATMYGEVRPELTNERARRARSAMQVKKMKTSLSVGARGLRSGTEIHAVAKTEQGKPEEEEAGGAIGKAKNWLSG